MCVIVEHIVQNSVQKLVCTAEMSTEVAGGYFFILALYVGWFKLKRGVVLEIRLKTGSYVCGLTLIVIDRDRCGPAPVASLGGGGGWTAPVDTLQGRDAQRKKIMGKFTKNSG